MQTYRCLHHAGDRILSGSAARSSIDATIFAASNHSGWSEKYETAPGKSSGSTVLCPTAALSLLTSSPTGMPPTTAACWREAILATPFRSRGFFSFLKGGARPIRTSSNCGYRSSNAPTFVDGRIGKSAAGNDGLRERTHERRIHAVAE